ncbi:MAG: protein-disulfide reductase DsbD domain-containing protein [Planctomycetota bacterium]
MKPTLESLPTPENYRSYMAGADLGETMPMWRVQTQGYRSHPGQLIGLVARSAGFLDSPDAEWIAGGVNSKGPDAVALGRHGNVFHWGFAASPTYMTDEAKAVFVNAIHYVAEFEDEPPIVRKRARTIVRSDIDETLWRLERSLPSMVKRMVPADVLEQAGDDVEAIRAYFEGVRPYVRSVGSYQLEVDEDAQRLGAANNSLELLERAIEALGSDEDEVALRVLVRYTGRGFETAEAWGRWLAENRDQMFFSEAGGYRWYVNRRSAAVDESTAPKASAQAPLQVALTAQPRGDGCVAIKLHVDIYEGWHTYASVPEGSAYVPLSHRLDLPEGWVVSSPWSIPEAVESDDGTSWYTGSLVIQCEVKGEGKAAIGCRVRGQVCDHESCMPPMNRRYEVQVGRN